MNSFFINPKDAQFSIKKSKERLKEYLFIFNLLIDKEKKTKLSKEESAKLISLVESAAIECTMQFFWKCGYWILREQQTKGPMDLYVYKIVNGEKIEYAVDVKGIRPNAKKKPAHKPTLPTGYEKKSHHIRDQILKRVVAIVYLKDEKTRKQISFTEGWHTSFKGGQAGLTGKRIKINKNRF